MGGYFHSFLSQMRCRSGTPRDRLRNGWNDPQLDGHVHCPDDVIDFGAVIPSVLRVADIPDFLALIMPRRILFCQARDQAAPDIDRLRSRLHALLKSTSGNDLANLHYEPQRSLNAQVLLDWLRGELHSNTSSRYR